MENVKQGEEEWKFREEAALKSDHSSISSQMLEDKNLQC